jgi:hypothetical protein
LVVAKGGTAKCVLPRSYSKFSSRLGTGIQAYPASKVVPRPATISASIGIAWFPSRLYVAHTYLHLPPLGLPRLHHTERAHTWFQYLQQRTVRPVRPPACLSPLVTSSSRNGSRRIMADILSPGPHRWDGKGEVSALAERLLFHRVVCRWGAP